MEALKIRNVSKISYLIPLFIIGLVITSPSRLLAAERYDATHEMDTIIQEILENTQQPLNIDESLEILTALVESISELALNSNESAQEVSAALAHIITNIIYASLDTNLIQLMDEQELSKMRHKDDREDNPVVREAFANIVSNVANILADPHNPHNLGQSIGNMLAGIVNAALLAARHNRAIRGFQHEKEALRSQSNKELLTQIEAIHAVKHLQIRSAQ